jgi:hypothetical protein
MPVVFGQLAFSNYHFPNRNTSLQIGNKVQKQILLLFFLAPDLQGFAAKYQMTT